MPLSGTLTKAKIIDTVAESNGYTRKKSIETVETVLELIKRSLESGEDVLISGFGKFCMRNKRVRQGRNPATGQDTNAIQNMVLPFPDRGPSWTNRIQGEWI